jgi:predicted regulator of Ras-like GTPase activity (Roadblock/LC7/MglB family)
VSRGSVGARMDVAEALARLTQDSSQVERAVVIDAGGSVLGSTLEAADAAEALAQAARDLVTVAGELRSGGEVTRVEVELAEGAIFVLREGDRTIAATTGAKPTAGLVAYDLRTCLHAIGEPAKPKRRATRKPKEGGE